MLIKCKNCNIKNDVFEVQELSDIEQFENRILIRSVCRVCKLETVGLIEFRKSDGKVFFSTYLGNKADRVLKREKRRVKSLILSTDSRKFKTDNWAYGKNIEIKNKKGAVVQVRQYRTSFSGKRELVKKNYLTV